MIHATPDHLRLVCPAMSAGGEPATPSSPHTPLPTFHTLLHTNAVAIHTLLPVHTNTHTHSGGLVWFLSILCPFYGAINVLYSALALPLLGFVLPSVVMLKVFKYVGQEGREGALSVKSAEWLRAGDTSGTGCHMPAAY